ncbi:MAG: bifunctional DNA-binding transcriptional regulator/O6-methylguanine-DNA methyltransferase Ada [Bryobacteraceae bacterium]
MTPSKDMTLTEGITSNEAGRLNAEGCWLAVQMRDASQDGCFFYGVLTTGVYCRPSCPARRPNRENVRFYGKAEQAEREGLRPCRRCHPLAAIGAAPLAGRIRDLCAYIEANADAVLTLADLGRCAGLSPYHLQRTFKAIVGVSPKQYLEERRMQSFKSILRRKKGGGVTGAIYEAGFGSSSRLYEKADTRLGMTPIEYRSGGAGVEITYGSAETALGLMMMGATDRGLCFVQFGESAAGLLATLKSEYPKAALVPMPEPAPAEFTVWMSALRQHLEGRQPDLGLPVHVRATAFQMKVWQYLRSIPPGAVQAYGEVAKTIGAPRAARAVARVCASNPVAIAIPCHRVIRGTGALGGYRWGLERKRVLIDRERDRSARE